uniref:Uncharacterized protein n=1 Tax=Ixodes scapularis TaxID=6945 RepID=A0A4D5RBZ1_IXOSC
MGILYENSSRIAFSVLFAIMFYTFGLVLVKCRQGDENGPLVTLGRCGPARSILLKRGESIPPVYKYG